MLPAVGPDPAVTPSVSDSARGEDTAVVPFVVEPFDEEDDEEER